MPRTNSSQFQLLVEFMARNGDLSKPTEGPQGRATNIRRWSELGEMLYMVTARQQRDGGNLEAGPPSVASSTAEMDR
ncbi:unnamed protein product [Leptidea sinapis]|uniref:Uncharacterized protein n=1 Tax=Leptidea sinapis TaxID=189913 RepID=A0A5E4PWH2_9NEOP|nr:unnamed protein product [Leptidea sinapis]